MNNQLINSQKLEENERNGLFNLEEYFRNHTPTPTFFDLFLNFITKNHVSTYFIFLALIILAFLTVRSFRNSRGFQISVFILFLYGYSCLFYQIMTPNLEHPAF